MAPLLVLMLVAAGAVGRVTARPASEAVLTMAQTALPTFPLFRQCDPQWGNEQMGVKGDGERATVCREGCAMSSLAMALAGLGIDLPDNKPINPGTLNSFLVSSELYTCAAGDCNNLVLPAPEAITPRLQLVAEHPKPPAAEMNDKLAKGATIFLAHVHNSGHFVLLTGKATGSPDEFACNDPFFNSTTYPYANISDVIEYSIVTAPSASRTPHAYPLYKQCDKRWGSHLIESQTVCQVGCLMSSISMALGGHGIAIAGKTSNPGSLNAWLRTHDGYTSGNDLKESVVPQVNQSCVTWPADGMHTSKDLSLEVIKGYLLKSRVVIANVMHGEHFVLVTGFPYQGDDLLVNDPGFNKTTYSFSNDVVGWRLFDMC